MILPDMPNLAQIAFLMHQANEELETQTRIVRARELDAGSIDPTLATKTASYLVGGEATDIEGINLPTIVLRTITRRIDVQSISSTDETLTKWLENAADAAELDIIQGKAHRWAERDGESFIIVDYDRYEPRPWEEGQRGIPKLYVHQRYTSAEATWREGVGSNEGCKAHYRNDDPNQKLEMVSKRWIETTYEDEELVARSRMTLYIAEQAETAARIEKYIMNDGGEWEEHRDSYIDDSGALADEEWPIWWTDDGTENGISLPIPVVHFPNEEIEPIAQKITGLQNGMDQAWSALLGNLTLAGHPLLVAFGFYPTTDGQPPNESGSNLLKVGPRQILGSSKSKNEASLDMLEPTDPRPVIDAMDKIAIYASFVMGLPVNNFVVSKMVASSSTLRQGEADLVAHVHALQKIWKRKWSQVYRLMAMMANLYGGESLNTEVTAVPVWAPVETVNVEAQTAEGMAKKNTGIPDVAVWRDVWGYEQEQVDKMLEEQAAQRQREATTSAAGEPGAAAGETIMDNEI